VASDRGEEGFVGVVLDTEFLAGFFDHLGQSGVMDVADLVEQVVLDLEVQAAEEPAEKPVASGKIDGGLDLMDGPFGLHAFGAAFDGDGDWEIGLFDAVSELEYDAEDYAGDEGCEGVDAEDGPPVVEEHGDAEGHGEEDDLSADEHEEVFAFGAGDFVAADVSGGDLLEVVNEVPFDGEKSV
jgi:hypothetical protein